MSQLTTATCFGKIPSRGDFVKGPGQHQLISLLDRWVSQAMELLSDDPRWKTAYDQAPALDFAFVGARSRLSVLGHLRASTDASGRRFPFMSAATVERDDALMFRCAPAGLAISFGALARVVDRGVDGEEVPTLLAALDEIHCAQEFEQALGSDPLGNFVRGNTLRSLANALNLQPAALRRIVLAIGLLLQPVVGQGQVSIARDLVFPLPADERGRLLGAALWLYLVTAFLRKTSVELALIIVRQPGAARLVLGFNGSAPDTLVSALSPDSVTDRIVPLHDPAWVEESPLLRDDYGIAKLSTYLEQPDTPIEQLVSTFREVFLGE